MENEVRVISVGVRKKMNGQVLDSVDLQVKGTKSVNLRELRVVLEWHTDESTVNSSVLLAKDWDMELAPWTRIRIQLGQIGSSITASPAQVCIRIQEEYPLEEGGLGDLQVLSQEDKLLDAVTIDVDANPVWYRDLEDRR